MIWCIKVTTLEGKIIYINGDTEEFKESVLAEYESTAKNITVSYYNDVCEDKELIKKLKNETYRRVV